MRDFPSIALFTLAISLLYTGVARVLPQLEKHPPARLDKLPSDVGPDVLSEMGAGAFESGCAQCHKLGDAAGRGPDLANVGGRAKERAKERAEATGQPYTDVDYLLESLCKPGDYLVEGYGNIMPPQGKALDGGQLLAVTAYLQNLGGAATVTGNDIDPLKRFECPTTVGGGGGGSENGEGGAAVAGPPVGSPEEVFNEFGCANCHAVDSPEIKAAPSLFDIGKRLEKGEIYEAILVPEAKASKGFEGQEQMMRQTLDGNGFYQRMRPGDYQALVDWLAQMQG